MNTISHWVWAESFWLPSGYSWSDLKSTPEVPKPQLSQLYIVPILALFLSLVRFVFERFIALPICKYFGIRDGKRVKPNPICEKVFGESPNPSQEKVRGLANQLSWTEKQVLWWFCKRRDNNKNSPLKKATETCWRCLVYFSLFVYGCAALLPTEWFYSSSDWIRGYIRDQPFTPMIKWYYLVELSFYTSLLFSQFLDHKRKDFWQMFLHHIVTIFLIVFSFTCGFFRYGAAIMFLHDASDYWLEAAKITNYMKLQKLCDVIFVVFAIVFYLTRWFYFPYVVIASYLLEAREVLGYYGASILFTVLVCTLQLLHIYWGFLIGRMIYRFAVVGKVEKDTRSEDESSDDETGDSECRNKRM